MSQTDIKYREENGTDDALIHFLEQRKSLRNQFEKKYGRVAPKLHCYHKQQNWQSLSEAHLGFLINRTI